MNKDFPRILSLLRKERGLSQKQVANDLSIAQALLSHYEKGKRECGLDFVVRAASYYNVSTDYLLGRSPSSTGSVIVESEIPETKSSEKSNSSSGDLVSILNKKLITNSIDIIFSLLNKTNNSKLTQSVSSMMTLSVYRAFRIIYKSNPKNDKNIFSIDEKICDSVTDAAILIEKGKAHSAMDSMGGQSPLVTTISLEEEYDKQATALLNLIKNSENTLKKFDFEN